VSWDNLLPVIELRASNLDEHQITCFKSSKKSQKFNSAVELKAHSSTLLLPIKCLGMNPYKIVRDVEELLSDGANGIPGQ
jgi:hypothetical protein